MTIGIDVQQVQATQSENIMAIQQEVCFISICEEEDYCWACDDYLVCSGVPCSEHPIRCSFKGDPVLCEFDCALRNGSPWGDIICHDEEMRLNARTPEQIENDLHEQTKMRRMEIEGLRKYVVEKSIRQHCEMVNGKVVLKHKMRKGCENLTLPSEKLPDGSSYEGGCWAHHVGACPFMHPGEEAMYEFGDKNKLLLQKRVFEEPKKPEAKRPEAKKAVSFAAKPPVKNKWAALSGDAW